MKRFATVLVLTAMVAGISMIDQPSASADDDACKAPGSCPLHDWMEKELDAAMEKGDAKKLAEGLDKVAGFSPDPAWNEGETSWSKIAKAGAEKAKAGDVKGAGEACKTCHKAWRKQYKEKHRSKALPK